MKEKMNNNEINILHISSATNLVDILTKPLERIRFNEFRNQLSKAELHA